MTALSPAVSVVVPAYNAQAYIAAALRSILAQTFADLEVVVVDDGSTDATCDVVGALAASDPRVRLCRQNNSGRPAVARNVGISLTRGEFVGFLDADDEYDPRKLERQLGALGTVDGAAAVYSDYRNFVVSAAEDAQPPYLGASRYVERMGPEALRHVSGNVYVGTDKLHVRMLLDGRAIGPHTCSILIRKDALRRHDLRFREDLTVAEDTEFYIRLARAERMCFLDEPLSYYRWTPGSISRRTDAGIRAADGVAAMAPLLSALQADVGREAYDALRPQVAEAWRWLGSRAWYGGRNALAREMLVHALRTRPTWRAARDLLRTGVPQHVVRIYRGLRWPERGG